MDIVTVVRQAIGQPTGELETRGNDVIRVAAVEIYPRRKMAALLFRRSDPNAGTPIFEHTVTKKLRRSDKQIDEGVAVSAHVFVHFGGTPDETLPTYNAILEEMHGVSRTYIQALLTKILRDYEYTYTDHRGEEQSTHTLVEFFGLKSEKVSAALQQSTVPYILLVRPGNIEGLDIGGEAVATDQRMKIVLKAKHGRTMDIIDKILPWARKRHWRDVVVRLNLPEDRSRMVFLTREQDAKDVLFIRSEPVKVKSRLDPCAETVNEELAAKAAQMFTADGLT
jgi:hypothetical protein